MDLRVREVTVGTIVLVAILVFVFGTMWLSGRRVGAGNTVRIQFANVSGLKRASPLRISGVNVGKVEAIDFVDVGKVLVEASLPPQIVPRADASAEIVSVTFVGDYAVDFDPGRSAQALPKGTVIVGSQEVGLSDRAGVLADRADSVLLGANRFVSEEMAERLENTLVALQATLKATQQTMQVLSNTRTGPTAELMQTMASFRALSARLDSTLAQPALGRTLQRADTLTGNLTAMTSQLTATSGRLDTLLLRINEGQGTLGKFATDSALYFNMVRATAQLDSLMAAIRANPGKIPIQVRIF